MDIDDCITHIKNSIQIINEEIGELAQRLATVEADVRWIKRLVWVVLGGTLALVLKAYLAPAL